MDVRDILWLSYKDLSEKRVRTALTILMVMIGVAAIVALTSLTSGISQSIQTELSSLGPTSIILTSTKTAGFTLADTSGISTLANVSSVTPIVEGSATLVAGTENSSVTIVGISPDGLQELLGGSINLYEGSNYTNTVSPSSVIGYSAAFPTTGGKQNVGIGEPITLKIGGKGGSSYTVPVVGILQSYSSAIISINSGVFMSTAAAETLLHKTSFNTILVKASNTSSVASLTTELTDIYGNNARVLSTQQLAATAASIIGSISLLLVVIAGISLLVAAIGIMNIMLMSVLERTHEIGIMKSLGFKRRDILTIFLFQALIIGVAGGIVGIVVGGGGAYGLAALTSHAASTNSTTTTPSSGTTSFRSGSGGGFAGGAPAGGGAATFSEGSSAPSASSSSSLSFSPDITISTIIEALLVAVTVSALAGVYPAWRASKLEPIDALRQL